MEGAGEGMVAVVQALQDAGLSVTLTNPIVRNDQQEHRSEAYNGMSNLLKWNGHTSRAINCQTNSCRRSQAQDGSRRNGMNNNYQLQQGSQSTGSPLNRHADTSPYGSRQNSNNIRAVAKRNTDIVTQTPGREALSNRSSAYWSQRATPSMRPSRGTDAFAESLRKYPCVSPERSTSLDIIQRLINYTQSKNLTKSSYHSKSLRSLRNTTEPSISNISKNPSKNIQTYTRRESPAREISPYSQDRFNDRNRSLHRRKSDGVRCKDNGLNSTYEYLKGVSSRCPPFSPPRTTEVRYLEDVTKYVRNTIKNIYDEQASTRCPNIATRYNYHKRECPKNTGLPPPIPVSDCKEMQTSSTRYSEVSTVTPDENLPDKLRPKTCNTCHKRKIRFSNMEPCPRYTAQEIIPKLECPQNETCPYVNPEAEFVYKLNRHVLEWFKEIPVNIKFCSLDKKDRTKIVMDLVGQLMTLHGVDNCEGTMRKYVLDCLENLPMWLPSRKIDQEVLINELADDLINRLRDLFKMRDKFDETVAKWVDGLNFDCSSEPVNKEDVIQDFINRLKPLVQHRTDDNDLLRDNLKENIFEMLQKLPHHIEGSNIKYCNQKADILADALAGLPEIENDEKGLDKKLIYDRLKNADKAKGLNPSERKILVEQLLENVKNLITRIGTITNDDERHEIIRNVVDDWIRSTNADPSDLINYLTKKILEWLHNKPEFSGDSISIVKDNEEISKGLAEKVKDILPELLEDDNVKHQLLEDINDRFTDTLEKRGDQNDPNTTKELAKDLLNYLVNVVKELQEGNVKNLGNYLKNVLRNIILESLNEVSEPAGSSTATKRDNYKFSNDLSTSADNNEKPWCPLWDWFGDIPELCDDKFENKLNVDAQDKQLNELGNCVLEKDFAKEIEDWLQATADKKKVKMCCIRRNQLRKKLMDALYYSPSRTSYPDEDSMQEIWKLADSLADRLVSLKDEGGDIDQKLQDAVDDWLCKTSNERGVYFNDQQKEKLHRNLMDALKSAPKLSRSLEDDDETKRKVWNWFKDIPELSGGDSIENNKLVQGLANKLKKFQDDGKHGECRQKIKDEIDNWLEDTCNKKDVKLNKEEKEKMINKLSDAFMPLPRSQSISANGNAEQGPLWDWFKNIPELSGDKLENKLNVDALDKQLKQFGDIVLDTDNTEEIENAIEDWLEDMADKKKKKMYSKRRKQLRKKLMDALKNNNSSRRYSNEYSVPKICEWFMNIPEISRGDSTKNKELVKNLDDKLKEVQNQGLKEEIAKRKMQDIIDGWLQDMAKINGEKLNMKIKEKLRNNLMLSLQSRPLSKPKENKPHQAASDDFGEFNNGQQIRDWYNNIPEISNGNQSDDTKDVDGLIKNVQKIENVDSAKGQNKLKVTIESWLRGMTRKKKAKLNKIQIENHRNNLMDALKPKQINIMICSSLEVEGQKTEKQKVQEWFENISKLSDGKDAENQKSIDDLVKMIEKIHEQNDGNGKIADQIKDQVDTWIKTVSKKKRVRLNPEEVEALKETLLDSITDKPRKNAEQERQEVVFSDETNSDALNKTTNSESLESDKDTDESNTTSNKPKQFKDASTDIDERRKIAEWLKTVPDSKFDDKTESILIDKFYTRLQTLRNEGKGNNTRVMNPEVKNWLEDIVKITGSKLDNKTKNNLVKKLTDSLKSKKTKNRNDNLSSEQSIDDNAQKARRSPENPSQTTYYSHKDSRYEIFKKEINTKTPDGENEIAPSTLSYSKDRKRWNKEPDVDFRDHRNNDESPMRSIESQLNKNDTDTNMSEDEEIASRKSLFIKTPELESPSPASYGSQLDSKPSPTKPMPETDLRQQIIGAGIEPKIMPESSYQSPNKREQNQTIKERQKSKGSISSLKKSSDLKDLAHYDNPLTKNEISLRQNPRLRGKSDVASRNLIEKTIMKTESKFGKTESPSMSNRSTTGIYYVEEESDSNQKRLSRKSKATQHPARKSSKRSGEGKDSTKTPIKFDKLTKSKISDFLAKNIDTITSPNYADAVEDLMVILAEDSDLPASEIGALARMIIKRTRRNNGIKDSNDDSKELDVALYDFSSDNEDDLTEKNSKETSKARHLVRGVLNETYNFGKDTEIQIQLEDAIVDLITKPIAQGEIDDPTRDTLLQLLYDANVPANMANDICEKIIRRAPRSASKKIESALTPNQKLTFLKKAQSEITHFYDELTGTSSAGSREIVNDAIKDTVAKLADILDNPELTGSQKEDMMRNEIIRYFRKLPTQSNIPEEDLANQLMDRLKDIKFTSSTPEHSEDEGFYPRKENLDQSLSTIFDEKSLSTIFDENELDANEIFYADKILGAIKNWSDNIGAIKKKEIGFKENMAKELANDVIDRQKYFQVNPHAKSSPEEELEHSKYMVFKWLNKMANFNDLEDCESEVDKLVNAIRTISVPKMAEPMKSLAPSRISQGTVNYENPLEADIAEWLQHVPKNLYDKDNPYIQKQQIKEFVDAIEKHKDKPNVEQLAGKEINNWLPTMVKADQLVIETMGNQLKSILKRHGFMNPAQGSAMSQNELIHDLGLIPMDTDRESPKFKKATDVLYGVVDKWCKDLPIYRENPNEDPEKTSALKQNISSKLIYKLGEFNMNPEILNDDFLYEDLLLDEVDRQLKDVSKNPELDKYLPALKMELAAKVKEARQKIRDELAGKAYKQELRDVISTSICLADNVSPDEQASFEILKDNLADAFINLHYVPDNPEDAQKFKMKINDEINRFCDEFLRRHPRLPVDRRKLTRDLYAALLTVPVPRDESMMHEVEQTRIKDIINDWMKELPLRDETLTEQLHRNKTASLLAKRLHELENEKASNPDLENEMFEEISKWLRKQQLRPGQEVYIPEFAEKLKKKLINTENSRRFDLSARPPHHTQSRPCMVSRIPPCTLSREDRSHLKRIRERRCRSPSSRDNLVCPRMDPYSQTDVKPKFSDRGSWCRKELCPRITQIPTGTQCFIRQKRDASCMTPTQSPYEISPNVVVNKYYWDTTDDSKQQTSSQQTQPPLQQPQDSQGINSEYQTPQHSYHAPPPDFQSPRRSSSQQTPHNFVPPGSPYTTPQASTSSAHRRPSCECYQSPNEEIPCMPTPYNTRYRPFYRSTDASSGEENYPEPGTSRCKRVRVTRLGSLDNTSSKKKHRRPEQKKSRSIICDDDSEWSFGRFPDDGEFWDCPRRLCGAQEPFIQEKEKRQEKFKCKCKERVTSCRGRNGRSSRENSTRHCNVNCPHPSYMYFQ